MNIKNAEIFHDKKKLVKYVDRKYRNWNEKGVFITIHDELLRVDRNSDSDWLSVEIHCTYHFILHYKNPTKRVGVVQS
jgi:hypothetical protein